MIGFFNLSYQASESDAFITVEFGILNGGMTQTDIDIELFTTDLAALSKFLFCNDPEMDSFCSRWR